MAHVLLRRGEGGNVPGLLTQTAEAGWQLCGMATGLSHDLWVLVVPHLQEWCNSTLGQAIRSWLLHKRETREPLIDLLLGLLIDVAGGVGCVVLAGGLVVLLFYAGACAAVCSA